MKKIFLAATSFFLFSCFISSNLYADDASCLNPPDVKAPDGYYFLYTLNGGKIPLPDLRATISGIEGGYTYKCRVLQSQQDVFSASLFYVDRNGKHEELHHVFRFTKIMSTERRLRQNRAQRSEEPPYEY